MDEKIISIEEAMALAIAEARLGAPYVSPNPLVGCVILNRQGQFLSKGYHEKYGEAHAEINALKNLTVEQLQDATVVVTLEPCAHQGKTPSCAKHLAQLPIKKVVFGLIDPNPLVAGQGADILKKAGIEAVEYQGPLKDELYEVCEIFLKNYVQKKIFVSLKVATSLDGFMGLKSGESQWITGPEAREQAHQLRAAHDLLIVGRKTIEIDNPRLDVRHPTINKKNKILVIDPSGDILRQEITGKKQFNIFSVHDQHSLFFAIEEKHLESGKFDNLDPSWKKQIFHFTNLKDLLNQLWNKGFRSVFVEGGAMTLSSFLKENLVDRIYLFMAPVIIGHKQGLSWTESVEIRHLTEKLKFQSLKHQKYGHDLLLTAKIE